MRGLRNFYAEEPYQHSIYYTNNLMAEIQWTKAELLQSAAGQSYMGVISKVNFVLFSKTLMIELCYINDRTLLYSIYQCQ